MRVKCLVQEDDAMSPARARPGPLDPEVSTLTMRPPLFSYNLKYSGVSKN